MLWFRRRCRLSTLLFFLYLLILFSLKDYIFSTLADLPKWFGHASPAVPVTVRKPAPPVSSRNVTKRELVLLQMLFRHGHRAPFNVYPSDRHPASIWKEGFGQLTQLGRLQHFVLGDHLLNRYRDFITTNPNEVELISADSSRCQYGAYAFVAGLYAPSSEFSFLTNLRWQPIISRPYPKKDNKWVLSRRKCPVASADEKAYKESQEAADMRRKYELFYTYWSKHSGKKIKDWARAADLGKTFQCERDYNLSIPAWALKYWDEFEIQEGLAYYWHFRTKLIQRYRTGPLLGFMLEKMKQKIAGQLPKKRVFIYSAHGSNIACYLMSLEHYNMLAPPVAATVVIELWKEDDARYSVRLLYFNSSQPERELHPPYVLGIGDCNQEFCPLEYVKDFASDLIPDDWVRECHDPSQRKRFPPPIYIPSSSTRIFDSAAIFLFTLFQTLIASLITQNIN